MHRLGDSTSERIFCRLLARLPAAIHRRVRVRFQEVVATTTGHVPPRPSHSTFRGRPSIAPDTGLRVGQALDTRPEYWLNLQRKYHPRPSRHGCVRQHRRPIRRGGLNAEVCARTSDEPSGCGRKSPSAVTFPGGFPCTGMPRAQWT